MKRELQKCPTLASVKMLGAGELLGYVDLLEPAPTARLYLNILLKTKVIYVYEAVLNTPARTTRVFVYDGQRQPTTPSKDFEVAFLFLFSHLKSNAWDTAWTELAVSSATHTTDHSDASPACRVRRCARHPTASISDTKSHRKRFSLRLLFDELQPPIPMDLVGGTENVGNSRILNLPLQSYLVVASFCDAKTIDCFGTTCRAGHAMVFDAIPGMLLTLKPHQRAALRWMLLHEGRTVYTADTVVPWQRPFEITLNCYRPPDEAMDDVVAVVDFVECTVRVVLRAQYQAERRLLPPLCTGGMHCDDPGLGKTITMLALVLRTKHHLPKLTNIVRSSEPRVYYAPIDRETEMEYSSPRSNSGRRRLSGRVEARISSDDRSNKLRIVVSSTTLIVVPSTLVAHWEEQIRLHVAQGGLNVRRWNPGREGNVSPDELSKADVVLTTFADLTNEWRRNQSQSVLMQIHWLRIVLDEGHELGKSVSLTNRLQMCCMMRAERRWVMTGTPTPNGVDSEIRHLLPLFRFLQIPPFHLRSSASAYKRLLRAPFEAYNLDGIFYMRRLLQQSMIRSNKRKLREFPVLKEHDVILAFRPNHAKSYSQLVEVVQRNLLLADWFDGNHQESLLNEKRGPEAAQTASNVRLSCCLAGNMQLRLSEVELSETLNELQFGRVYMRLTSFQDFVDCVRIEFQPSSSFEGPRPWFVFKMGSHGLGYYTDVFAVATHHFKNRPKLITDERRAVVSNALQRGCRCERCSSFSVQPIVTPCACLLCAWCTKESRTECPLCRKAYEMQSTGSEERLALNKSPQWEVPFRLIELQPSYTQGGLFSTSESIWNKIATWKLNFAATEEESSKVTYIMSFLEKFFADFVWQEGGQTWKNTAKNEERKVIIFSQFYLHLLAIEQALERRGIPVAQVYGNRMSSKVQEIQKFKTNANVPILLMDINGAVGLDLFFVSHLFLMDPIVDKSLEEQIIARAWRMGAKDLVHVYRLVMKDSVEHHMLLKTDRRTTTSVETLLSLKRVNIPDDEGR